MKYPLRQLYIYYGSCNLRCRHCWLAPEFQESKGTKNFLPIELFKKIIKEAKPLGLQSVKLTGGEPLLHPEIADMFHILKENEVGVTIETNGLLCTEEMVKEIAALNNPFLAVSLDGVDSITHEWMRGVKGSFDKAVKGIQTLVSHGIKPQIIMTLVKRNKDSLEDLIHLAEELGASSVKFNIVQPTKRGEDMQRNNETIPISELIEMGKIVEMELSKKTKLRLHFDHPPAFRPLSKLYGEKGSGCGTCGIFGILGILGDGSYALCGVGSIIKEMIFGNANYDSLKDVWENTPMLNSLREGLPEKLEGVCKQCVMKNQCLGCCIAQNYYTEKNLMAPFWFCEQAHQQGLFPSSRLRQ